MRPNKLHNCCKAYIRGASVTSGMSCWAICLVEGRGGVRRKVRVVMMSLFPQSSSFSWALWSLAA
eukprot:1049641-Pelagomonas_calceolata.AAC.3